MTRDTLPASLEDAEALDWADPLREARDKFLLLEGLIYLDGHSLGPATHSGLQRLDRAAKIEWAEGLIRSWNDAGWIDLPSRVGAKIARLIGVRPEDVIVTDSVSVNLFKLAAAALPLARNRTVIVETSEFPTDQYIAEGLSALSGAKMLSAGENEGEAVLAREGGVLIKSVVNYRTSLVADIPAHEAAARRGGGVVVWDLSHAAGVLALDLENSDASLAAGCTYKFLNGGPGAPAFVYVRGELASRLASPISGWMGHAAPFAFDNAYAPREGVARFASGTPGVLSLSALAGALDAFDGVERGALASKARRLGDLCLARGAALGLEPISPGNSVQRGGHVSLRHEEGYAIVQALAAAGVIADFRAPDAMRFGFAPLYVGYADVWRAMDALEGILATRTWDDPRFLLRKAVT